MVDNASRDGSAAAVRERFPGVRLIANPENVGFARACNQGARASRAPFLLFLNPDATLAPGSLATLTAHPRRAAAASASSARARAAPTGHPGLDGPRPVAVSRAAAAAPRARRRAAGRRGRRRGRGAATPWSARSDWVSGACLMIRREALRRRFRLRRALLPLRGGRRPLPPRPPGRLAGALLPRRRGAPRARPQHGARPRARAPRVPAQPPALLPQAPRPAAARRAPRSGSSRARPCALVHGAVSGDRARCSARPSRSSALAPVAA